MISHGELIGIAVLLVMSKGGKVIVGLQSECDVAYFREVKNRPFARSRPDTRSKMPSYLASTRFLTYPRRFRRSASAFTLNSLTHPSFWEISMCSYAERPTLF